LGWRCEDEQNAAWRPFVRLLSDSDELAVFDSDLEWPPRFRPGVLDPFAGELHSRIEAQRLSWGLGFHSWCWSLVPMNGVSVLEGID